MTDPAITALRATLHAVAVPADAPPMAAYMRDQFAFLGVRTPARRTATRELLRATGDWTVEEVVGFVDECWDQPEREFQYVASGIVSRQVKRFEADRLGDLRRWVSTISWWDTVDELAAHGVGTLARSHPACAEEMEAWIVDEDVWIARTAILHQLRWKESTDEDRLFRFVLLRATDTEFFLRKASGWALREYAKVAPDSVRRFVAHHEAELSGLTRREALKHL